MTEHYIVTCDTQAEWDELCDMFEQDCKSRFHNTDSFFDYKTDTYNIEIINGEPSFIGYDRRDYYEHKLPYHDHKFVTFKEFKDILGGGQKSETQITTLKDIQDDLVMIKQLTDNYSGALFSIEAGEMRVVDCNTVDEYIVESLSEAIEVIEALKERDVLMEKLCKFKVAKNGKF